MRAAGLRTVSVLQTGLASDGAEAERVLDECNLEVQAKGWHFNTRKDMTLTPDDSNYLNMPEGAITIDSWEADKSIDVVLIGSRLYNNTDNTYEFDDSIKVWYTELYSFACVPYPVKNYIAKYAAWKYALDKHDKGLLSGNRLQVAYDEYITARSEAHRFESMTTNVNMLNTTPFKRVRGDVSSVVR